MKLLKQGLALLSFLIDHRTNLIMKGEDLGKQVLKINVLKKRHGNGIRFPFDEPLDGLVVVLSLRHEKRKKTVVVISCLVGRSHNSQWRREKGTGVVLFVVSRHARLKL